VVFVSAQQGLHEHGDEIGFTFVDERHRDFAFGRFEVDEHQGFKEFHGLADAHFDLAEFLEVLLVIVVKFDLLAHQALVLLDEVLLGQAFDHRRVCANEALVLARADEVCNDWVHSLLGVQHGLWLTVHLETLEETLVVVGGDVDLAEHGGRELLGVADQDEPLAVLAQRNQTADLAGLRTLVDDDRVEDCVEVEDHRHARAAQGASHNLGLTQQPRLQLLCLVAVALVFYQVVQRKLFDVLALVGPYADDVRHLGHTVFV